MERQGIRLSRFGTDTIYDYLTTFIRIFIRTRRTSHELVAINRNHPIFMVLYPPGSYNRKQMLKHKSRCVSTLIHPFSSFALYWEFLMPLVFLLLLLIQNVAAFCGDLSLYHARWIRFIAGVIFVADIGKKFFTGYYDFAESRTVLNPLAVVKNYFKSSFFFDLFCSCYPILVTMYKSVFLNALCRSSCIHVFEMNIYLKIFDLRTWKKSSDIFWSYKRIEKKLSTVLTNSIILALLVLITLTIFVEADFRQAGHFYAALCVLFMINFHEKYFELFGENIVTTSTKVAMHCTRCLLIYTFTSNKTFATYMKQPVRVIKKTIRTNQLLRPLHEKLLNLLGEEEEFDEERQKVLMQIGEGQMKLAEFFCNLPKDAIDQCLKRLKLCLFHSGECIIRYGQEGDCAYFIHAGAVALFSKNGVEACHIEDGNYFGETFLVCAGRARATVVAVIDCQLYVLYRDDFLEILDEFPDYVDKVFETAKQRLQIFDHMLDPKYYVVLNDDDENNEENSDEDNEENPDENRGKNSDENNEKNHDVNNEENPDVNNEENPDENNEENSDENN